MLKVRIIPILLLRGNSIVKSVKFDEHRMIGDAVTAVKVFSARKADELIVLDIDAQSKQPDFSLIRRLSRHSFLPLTIGGGIKNLDMADNLFRFGADKVTLNSLFFNDIKTVKKIVKRFGAQAVTLSLDFKKKDNKYVAYFDGGKQESGLGLDEIFERIKDSGVGELLLNSIDEDGVMNGYDLQLLKIFRERIDIPIIIAGGCGNKDHMYEAVNSGADAISAGSIFHWVGESIISLKKDLDLKNIPVRLK